MNSTPIHTARNQRIASALLLAGAVGAGTLAAAGAMALAYAGNGLNISPARVEEVYIAMWVHAGIATMMSLAWLDVRRKTALGGTAVRMILLCTVVLGLVSWDRIAGVVCPPPPDYRSIFDADVVRGWRHHPGAHGAVDDWVCTINAHGLRGEDFPLQRGPGEFRIMFLGDSIAFGYALEESQTIPAQAQRLLRDHTGLAALRCMNAGVCGYATWQEMDYLKRDGLRLRPDLMVLIFCHNDFTDLMGVDADDVSGILPKFKPSAARFHWSGFVRAVRTIYDNGIPLPERWAGKKYGNHVKAEEAFARAATPERDTAVKRALRDLDELDEICRANKIPWVLVPFPLRAQFEKGGEVIRPEDILQTWCAARGVAYFDPRPAFAAHIAKTGCRPADLYVDGAHPSAEGSRLAAEEIAAFLESRRLAPEGSLANQLSGKR